MVVNTVTLRSIIKCIFCFAHCVQEILDYIDFHKNLGHFPHLNDQIKAQHRLYTRNADLYITGTVDTFSSRLYSIVINVPDPCEVDIYFS